MQRAEAEAMVRQSLEGACAAFGLGCGWEISVRPGARPVVEARLQPPAGAPASGRRWAQAAAGLQALVDLALSLRGEASFAVAVLAPEQTTAWDARELEPDEALMQAARRVAQRAAAAGRAFALGPMSAMERKVVHQALGELSEVWTQSEGDGVHRRLWVVPRPGRTAAPETRRESPPAMAAPASDDVSS